jgi:hypothetical protein
MGKKHRYQGEFVGQNAHSDSFTTMHGLKLSSLRNQTEITFTEELDCPTKK